MRFLSAIFLVAISFSASAQIESLINFRGQNSEVIKVDKAINVVRPEPYQVPDTCYNQIPYQNYECNDVTRYRESCHYIPASESCRTEYERVCRNVTRYRQECSNGPSRQVCRDNPSREVCVERPTREVCRTNSQGQEVCTTVGGGQSCQTVGGGQSCTTEAGDRVCRDVSYTDQDCDNIPRERCETIPGRNQCDQVAYSEEVCGNVTRYHQEPYACMRTEYRDVTTPKKLTGEIQVHITTNGIVEEFAINVAVAAKDAKFEAFTAAVKLIKDPKALVFLKKKEVKKTETAKEINIQGDISLEVVEVQSIAPVFPTKLSVIGFNESNYVLSLKIDGGISAAGSVEAVVMADPKIGKKKLVAELKAQYPSKQAGVIDTTLNLNFANLMQRELAKKNEVSVKLLAPLSVKGELLNIKKPVLEKSFDLKFRK